MSAFFFKDVPNYRLEGFCAVRDSFDNLSNILQVAESINTCSHSKVTKNEELFDIAIFSGNYCRILIKKNGGYFSMAIPFQVIDSGGKIFFTSNQIDEEVSGLFISIMRNAIQTSQGKTYSHEDIICSISDNFGLDVIILV